MRLLALPMQPDEKTIARSGERLKAHESWRIRQTGVTAGLAPGSVWKWCRVHQRLA